MQKGRFHNHTNYSCQHPHKKKSYNCPIHILPRLTFSDSPSLPRVNAGVRKTSEWWEPRLFGRPDCFERSFNTVDSGLQYNEEYNPPPGNHSDARGPRARHAEGMMEKDSEAEGAKMDDNRGRDLLSPRCPLTPARLSGKLPVIGPDTRRSAARYYLPECAQMLLLAPLFNQKWFMYSKKDKLKGTKQQQQKSHTATEVTDSFALLSSRSCFDLCGAIFQTPQHMTAINKTVLIIPTPI